MKYCGQCQHYEIIHDKNAPHGCRAYGFRTPGLPDEVVLQSTGLPCQLRKLKKPHDIEQPRKPQSNSSSPDGVSVQLSEQGTKRHRYR